MRKKFICTLAVSAMLALASTGTALAGEWVSDGDRGWMYKEDGGYHYGWLEINNKWYYLDSSGHCVTNSTLSINGISYVFDSNGVMQENGWTTDGNGNWYYVNSAGYAQTGWTQISGNWYYLDPNQGGKMLTGWQNINGTYYYMYDSGNMAASAWITDDDGNKYYLKPDGSMAVGWVNIANQSYLFNSNGVWIPDSDSGQNTDSVSETEEMMYNLALEDLNWSEIETVANKYFATFGSTPADLVTQLNVVRKREKLGDLAFSAKLTKAAYAHAIAQRAWGFEGELDYDDTNSLDYETALSLFDALDIATNVMIVRGTSLSDCMETMQTTTQGAAFLSGSVGAASDTCGVGFIRSAEDGDYICVIYLGKSSTND